MRHLVRLDGDIVLSNGIMIVSPSVTTEYTLTATGVGGPVNASVTVTVTSGPPVTIDSFTADDTTIQEGESTVLRWTTSNADEVLLDLSTVAADGSMTVAPTVTTTYELEAAGVGGPVDASVTVTVTATPPVTIDSFTADDTDIEFGESTVLRWTTSNATSVRINTGTVSADGSMTVAPTDDTTYRLVATGEGGPVEQSVTVMVGEEPDPAPQILSFTRSASTIDPGDSVVISWATADGDTRSLVAAPQDGSPPTTYSNQSAAGSRTFTPSVTTVYRIQVWNASDPSGTIAQRDITVTVRVPDVVSFTASATTIDLGDSVTLSWVTIIGDTRQLTADPVGSPFFVVIASASASGSRSVTPDVTTTYRISVWLASDPTGTVDSRNVTVTVN